MWKFASVVMIVLCGPAITHQANAVVCANGVYRAGCAGPNGAVIVRKPPVYRSPALLAPGVHTEQVVWGLMAPLLSPDRTKFI